MEHVVEIKRIRDCLRGQGDLDLALVFGSVASGRAGPDSDLDIALLFGQPVDARRKMQLIQVLAECTGRSVDLVDLHTVGEPLLGQIIQGGIRILGDDATYARLIHRHLLDQADFLPYRNRLLAERRKAWIQL